MHLRDVPAVILGNGPSLLSNDLELISGLFSIGINRSFRACESTVLLYQDSVLINQCGEELQGRPEIIMALEGTTGAEKQDYVFSVEFQEHEWKLSKDPLKYYPHGVPLLSATLGVMMARTLGCSPVILLGMDCCYEKGNTNFYGKNKHHNKQTLVGCVQGLIDIKKYHGEHIISCSGNTIFTREKLEDVIAGLSPVRKAQQEWRALLREQVNPEGGLTRPN